MTESPPFRVPGAKFCLGGIGLIIYEYNVTARAFVDVDTGIRGDMVCPASTAGDDHHLEDEGKRVKSFIDITT